MAHFIRKHPAMCLMALAIILALIPIAAVKAGLLPTAASQLGALSASLAAFILLAIERGRVGTSELLGRMLIWRVGWKWWAFALLFPVLPSIAALYVFNLFGGPPVDWSTLEPIWTVVPMIGLLIMLAGFGEEFGWRGFALPRLQARFNALQSSLIIGACWGLWHFPLYLTEGTSQHEWLQDGGWFLAVGGYIVFCMAWSIQYTWVFNNTGGSVLLAAVVHGAGNAWYGRYIDVYRGHFGGILTFTAVMVLVSIVIVVIAGPTDLSRKTKRNVLAPGS